MAITAITTATTRAITATGGVATIGLGGGIGITAGIMAGGAGTAGAAEVGGMAAADAAGMAADVAGMVTIDLKSKSPATFWATGPRQRAAFAAQGSRLNFSSSYALTNTKCWGWLLPICLISKSLINWAPAKPRSKFIAARSCANASRIVDRTGAHGRTIGGSLALKY